MDETRRLRELHDAYAWEVNAAIEEGREDLVWTLVDDYVREAMQVMTEPGRHRCGRRECVVCERQRSTSSGPNARGGRWWRLARALRR